MPKIKVTFEVFVEDGRLVEPSNPNNYSLVFDDALRESGRTWDDELNRSPHAREYSLRPQVQVDD